MKRQNQAPGRVAIPVDFPRQQFGGVPGAQVKLVGRVVNGQFVGGLSESELYERFEACTDLVIQLTAYARRKAVELPDLDRPSLLRKIRNGIRNKGWDLSPEELEWVMCNLEARLETNQS